MYALAINGSPRKDGNTALLLQEVLTPLTRAGWETELVQVGGKDIRGCIACYQCFENKDNQCSIQTDIFNEVMAKMLQAQAIILGSPTYFTDVTAELKALLDRSGLVSQANGVPFRGKIGAAVTAVRRAGATHVFDTINHMFLMSQMIVPGSTYWNMGYGFDKGEVSKDQAGIVNMRHLGSVINWLGAAVHDHLAQYPEPEGTII
ncbi:flavodoxin family protein [Desulfovermiculus halophilus]|uniref:flavodoxin family protein n=1 Tax=Desulfovermiculus halophilus TaxID=339722 RepID=UPI00047FA289|nr:flavodoxin family protein [Desulfovermiculus halophilus]